MRRRARLGLHVSRLQDLSSTLRQQELVEMSGKAKFSSALAAKASFDEFKATARRRKLIVRFPGCGKQRLAAPLSDRARYSEIASLMSFDVSGTKQRSHKLFPNLGSLIVWFESRRQRVHMNLRRVTRRTSASTSSVSTR